MTESEYDLVMDLKRLRLAENLVGECINFPASLREKKRQLMLVLRELKEYCEKEVEGRLRRVAP
jgi:hypothetical protein